MANDIKANPGPYIALPTVEDDAHMKRALKGATTSRSTAMAHVALRKYTKQSGQSHPRLEK